MSDRLHTALAELAAAIEELVEAATRLDERPPGLLSVDEAARRLGIGRTKIYDVIGAGPLRSVKVGRRRLIPEGAIADFIAAGGLSRAAGGLADKEAFRGTMDRG
jgi:excisionase family DNA binding protein